MSGGGGRGLIPDIKTDISSSQLQMRIARTLFHYVWPQDSTSEEDQKRKNRVMLSLGLMVSGKVVTIQVPFLFKYLVDSMPTDVGVNVLLDNPEAVATATLSGFPLALLMGYGISRITTSGMNEYRNAVFAHVAQDPIHVLGG